MDTPLMPDPASGETPSELGQPTPGENGGLAGASATPEHTPDPAAPQPWPASPPVSGWGTPAPPHASQAWPPAHPYWGMQQVAGAPMPMPARRRTIGLAFGGALVAGGLVGALVMAAVGDLHTTTSVSTTQPNQQAPLNNGGFGGRFGGGFGGVFGNGGGLGTGSGSGSGAGSSSSGNANIDAASIAAKVDPALVDITSYLADGEAAGTGMVITSGGQVLTNNHVVEGATRVTATMVSSQKTYQVTIVGTDPSDDVALLQLQGASNLKTVSIGDPSKVQVGDPIVAIGNALGAGGTPATATGEVVGVGQTITATDDTGANPETLQNLIQINADVQPGDSGGPLVNAQGQVIGMDTAASSSGRGFRFNNVAAQGFAIPIDAAMNDVKNLRNGGGTPQSNAQTAFLGVGIDPTSTSNGASVVQVEPGTPAASAGLAAGDTITGFAGKSISSPAALSTAVKGEKPGDKVQVTWTDTNGSSHSANVTLAGQSAAPAASSLPPPLPLWPAAPGDSPGGRRAIVCPGVAAVPGGLPGTSQVTSRRLPGGPGIIPGMDELTRILVVDDERPITDLVSMALRYEGFAVQTAATARDARTAMLEFRPALVVLDVGLPDEDGFALVQRLFADGLRVPVIFLTARDATEDKVRGLTVGGDDYVTKPFSIEELVARIRVVLRRHQPAGAEESRRLVLADLELDEDTHEVIRAGKAVELTRTEFRLLRYLLMNAGRVLSRAQILDHVWDYDFGGDASVLETYISYLRRKIDWAEPPLVHTVRGVGYVLRVPRPA